MLERRLPSSGLAVLVLLGLAAAAGGAAKSSRSCTPTWRVVPTPTVRAVAGLDGVTAVSSRDVWAVGGGARRPLVEHWDGARWSVVASPAVKRGTLFDIAP